MDARDYVLRRIEPDDLDIVSGMWSRMADQHRAYSAEVWCWSEEASDAWRVDVAKRLQSRDTIALMALDASGAPAGYVLGVVKDSEKVFIRDRHGEVWDLVVLPEHRGRGVAAMLMEACFEAMRARGAEDVILHVALENAAAIGLYEKLGMRRTMYRMFRKL